MGRRPDALRTSQDRGFDVFLSHNSENKDVVARLGEALKGRGITVWLDVWELRPGSRWQRELEKIINECRSAAVCVGADGLGPWEDEEMEALLRRFVKEKDRAGNALPLIPLLLPGAPADVPLPVFLEAFVWIDLREGLTEAGLDRLEWGITGIKRSGSGSDPESDEGETDQEPAEVKRTCVAVSRRADEANPENAQPIATAPEKRRHESDERPSGRRPFVHLLVWVFVVAVFSAACLILIAMTRGPADPGGAAATPDPDGELPAPVLDFEVFTNRTSGSYHTADELAQDANRDLGRLPADKRWRLPDPAQAVLLLQAGYSQRIVPAPKCGCLWTRDATTLMAKVVTPNATGTKVEDRRKSEIAGIILVREPAE